MTNLQAAVGVAQLEQLDDFILKKKEMGKLYQRELKEINCIELPVEKTDYAHYLYSRRPTYIRYRTDPVCSWLLALFLFYAMC